MNKFLINLKKERLNRLSVNKNTTKAVHLYFDTSIRVKQGYPTSEFAYEEVTEGNDFRGYFWDGQGVSYNSALIPQVDLIEQIRSAYEKHEQNGKSYFELKRANLVLLYKQGQLTSEQVYQVEDALEKVKHKVITGDWMTGLNELENTIPVGAYTTEMKAEIKTEIENYIANNYQ